MRTFFKQLFLGALLWIVIMVTILLTAIALVGCSHLTVAPKAVNARVVAFDENAQNAGIVDCDAGGCVVTPNWKAKYEQMEASFKNYVASDKNIKPDGRNFRVSYEVIEHNAGMKAAERGGP